MDIRKLVRSEIKNACIVIHGGEIFEAMENHGNNVIDFSANISPLGISKGALNCIYKALKDKENISRYPNINSSEVIKSIIDFFDSGITKENIIFGNGSVELIRLFCFVFLSKGDRVLIPVPTFGEYEFSSKISGAQCDFIYFLSENDFKLNIDEIINSTAEKTKAIFLCNPNNPTGKLIPRSELIKLLDFAKQKKILVFVDEAFIDFTCSPSKSAVYSITEYENLFVLRSLTKMYGLAGLRIGFGIGSPEIIRYMKNASIPWNVNYLAQKALIGALEDKKHVIKTKEKILNEKVYIFKKLQELSDASLKVFETDCNFLLIDISKYGINSILFKKKMLEKGILIRDCSSFRGLDNRYVRIAIKNRSENRKML
ncbi:MAG: pyridoxal phosphate-dependent aminotransferase, partial [Methanosarcinales archaeon]